MQLVFVPRGSYCLCCGKIFQQKDLQYHHTFFRRTKNKRLKSYVDDRRNITKVCANCHGTNGTNGLANSRKYKLRAWKEQCSAYGEASMLKWYKSVPLISTKERFWEE